MQTSNLSVFRRNLYCFLLLSLFTGCINQLPETALSPKYEYVSEYARSSDKEKTALLVPLNGYSRQSSGLETWQLVVLDADTYEVLHQIEGVVYAPRYIQWATDGSQLYFLQHDVKKTNPRFVIWDLAADMITEKPFYHGGFSISNSGEQIVAWNTLRESVDGKVYDVYDGVLQLYDLPDLRAGKTITVTIPSPDMEIQHVAWADDDRALLVLGWQGNPPVSPAIVKVNIDSGEQQFILDDLSSVNQFAWDSTNHLIAMANYKGIAIFNTRFYCYVKKLNYKRPVSQPVWSDDLELTFIKDNSGIKRNEYEIVKIEFEKSDLLEEKSCLLE